MNFQTDCAQLVKMVSKPAKWPAFEILLQDMENYRRMFQAFSLTHISREKNTKADKLARSARDRPHNVYFINSIPPASLLEPRYKNLDSLSSVGSLANQNAAEIHIQKRLHRLNKIRLTLAEGSEHLSPYVPACGEDPDLKSFDTSLHQRTNKIINSLDVQTDMTQSLHLDLLIEAYNFLFKASQEIVDIIIESKEDVGKHKELSSLVELYLENTTETLKLFSSVDKFVERAKNSQLIIRYAVQQFEAESEVQSSLFSFFLAVIQRWILGGRKEKKKYAKTLEELNKFKAKGDLLGEELVAHYESVLAQQVKLLEDFCQQKVKLDKKLKKVKKLKYFSCAFFVIAGVSVSVASVVALAVLAPHTAPAAAAHLGHTASAHFGSMAAASQMGQLARPIASTGKWVGELLNKYEKDVKSQKGLLTMTEQSTTVNKGATETISSQVKSLTGKISSILEQVDFAVEREEEEKDTRLAMQEIMKNVEEYTKKIEEVGETAAKLSKSIVSGRARLLDYIANSTGK
ncbi:unnamed protein product [Microthlaspi erraticum]|uniref:RNase H type-1 domain-containing protein n=1 Tax=Microthlaspi erraticum TaxID=1685480 RepID=A0A6D2K808_9BRAS|nr:unnamed protein product [Microthlaspi erraticum]